MGESIRQPATPSTSTDAWAALQKAFGQIIVDTVHRELPASPTPPGARDGTGSVDLKRTVTEAVGAVLLETSLVERVVEKQLKAQLAAAPPAGQGGGALAGEDARQEVGKAVREYLSRHLGMLFQTEIRGVIQKELKGFINSEELKELIDEKFRAINMYLKSEVIPKVVQQEMSKADA